MNPAQSKLGRFLQTRWRPITALLTLAILGYVIYRGSESPYEHHITVLGSVRDFSENVDTLNFHDHEDAFAGPWIHGENGGSHVAWLHKFGGKVRLFVDGVPGPPFDSISGEDIQLSPDEKHLAYTGKIGGKSQVVIDGVAGPLFDEVSYHMNDRYEQQVFDQIDGGDLHTLYYGKTGDQLVIVLDGEIRPKPAGTFKFSPDYKHLAAVNKVGEQFQIILDGKPGPFFDIYYVNQIPLDTDKLVFSPDSQHLAYIVPKVSNGQATGAQVILDGKPGPWFDDVSDIKFTANSQHLLYRISTHTDKEQMAVDGVPGPEYDYVLDDYGSFNTVGAYFAYEGLMNGSMGINNGRVQVVADGVPGPWYDMITWDPHYYRDSRLVYIGLLGGKAQIMVNGQPVPKFDDLDDAILSPDQKRLAYEVRDGAKWKVVLDGVPGPAFDRFGEKELIHESDTSVGNFEPGHIFFSDEGDHLGYVAKSGDKYFAVVDGVPGPPFDLIYGFTDSCWQLGEAKGGFSPDGRHTAYFGKNKQRTAWQSFIKWLGSPFARSSTNDDGGITQLVVDGVVVRDSLEASMTPGSAINNFGFSLDSQHYAFKAQDSGDGPWRVYVDNVSGPAFKQIKIGPLWRKDGQLEYVAVQEKNGSDDELVFVVVSGFSPAKP